MKGYVNMDSLLPGRAAAEISGVSAECFLNICPAMGVDILSARRVDEFTLLVELPACQLPLAENAARRSLCRVRVLRQGFGKKAARLLRRRALVFCLCACLLGLLFWSKFYIWEIQVSGNETVPTGEILSVLAACGVKGGAFWPELSSESVRSLVLEDMPELAWISVNMSGSLARVEVVERVSPPEMLYKGTATDLVAEKDGFVLSVSAPVGTALVSRGSAVSAGGCAYLRGGGKLLCFAQISACPGQCRGRNLHSSPCRKPGKPGVEKLYRTSGDPICPYNRR